MDITTRHKILIVDDDVSVRLMLARALEREGFEIDTARDGVEALEKIESGEYAAILLDLIMPRVGGNAVIRFLQERMPQVLDRIIVMSAFRNAEAEIDADSVANIVAKPVEIEEIVARTRELIAVREIAVPTTVDAPAL